MPQMNMYDASLFTWLSIIPIFVLLEISHAPRSAPRMRSIKHHLERDEQSDQQDPIRQMQSNWRRKTAGNKEKSSTGCDRREKAIVRHRQNYHRRCRSTGLHNLNRQGTDENASKFLAIQGAVPLHFALAIALTGLIYRRRADQFMPGQTVPPASVRTGMRMMQTATEHHVHGKKQGCNMRQ